MNDVGLNRRFVETDDEEACRLIFNAYYETVFDAVDNMRWNHPDTVVDPDDITGETFTKAFKKRKEIQEPEKLVEWLITAAKNLMIDKIRRARAQARHISVVPLDSLSIGEKSAHYATSLTETDAEQAEAKEVLVDQLLRLLQDQDREIADLVLDGLKPKEIAEVITSTSEAVQKKWERIRKWLIPIARNLDALIKCLPEENDRKIMERYFDRQSFSEITEALGISRSTVEKTVKRVIAQWKKAAKDNPTDPVSAMVKKER